MSTEDARARSAAIRLVMQRIEAMPASAQVVALALLDEMQDLRARVDALEAAAKPKKPKKPELVKSPEKKP